MERHRHGHGHTFREALLCMTTRCVGCLEVNLMLAEFIRAVTVFRAHRFPKPKVAGSNPAGRSKKAVFDVAVYA